MTLRSNMSESGGRGRSITLEEIGKTVPDKTRFVGELGLDSLEVVELVLAVEDASRSTFRMR